MLARMYIFQNRWKEAEELFTQEMKTQQKTLGAEDPSTMLSMAWLATSFAIVFSCLFKIYFERSCNLYANLMSSYYV